MQDKQPHDSFFKQAFSRQEAVADFLKGRLNKKLLDNLDLDTLSKKPDEFLPTRFRGKKRVDILWTVKTKQQKEVAFFFHLEGQARYDKDMAIRVLEYHTAIVKRYLQETRKLQCPPIITWVLYHGQSTWRGARNIAELFTDFDVYSQYGLQHDFLIDLPKENEARLAKDGEAAVTEMILARQAQGRLDELLSYVLPMFRDKDKHYREAVVAYLLDNNQGKDKEILEQVSKFDVTTGRKYNTMFELATQKSHQEGIKLGEQRGIQLERRNLSLRLIDRGLSRQEIANMLNINMHQLDELLKTN